MSSEIQQPEQPTVVRSRVQETTFGIASLTEYSNGEVIFTLTGVEADMHDVASRHVLTEEEKATADWTKGTPVIG